MKLISIRSNNRKDIVDDEIIVKMQSPLIVRRHDSVTNKDIYYTYADEGFSKALCENVEIFIQKMEIGVDTEGLSIEPVKARKVVVNCFGRKVMLTLEYIRLAVIASCLIFFIRQGWVPEDQKVTVSSKYYYNFRKGGTECG